MPINQAHYRWRDLNGVQRTAMDDQIVQLTDAFLDDIAALHAGADFRQTTMAMYLPRRCSAAYTLAFAKRFLVSLLAVTWKLKEPARVHTCANLAEELALYALIQRTEESLPPGIDDLGGFAAAAFESFDPVYLRDPPSAPTDWFELFDEEDRSVRPYLLLVPRPAPGPPDHGF